MSNRRPKKKIRAVRRGSSRNASDRRYLLQFVGAMLLLAAFLMMFPTVRTLYRWWNRSHYVQTPVEVVARPFQGMRRIWVRVLSSGEELEIQPADFDELHTGQTITQTKAERGQRFSAWYNPQAHARFALRLYDQRLLSVQRHPTLVTGSELLACLAGTLLLALLGGYLFRAPYRGN